MQAFLITGPRTSQEKEIGRLCGGFEIKPINRLNFSTSGLSFGIDKVREIKRHLTFKATGKGEIRGVVIETADEMTIEAQNAFLKILEEPPEDTIIILCAGSEDDLLPTIRSRCLLITTTASPTPLTADEAQMQKKIFEKLTKAEIGEKISFIEETGKSREAAISFVENQIAFLHSFLQENLNHPSPDLIRALLQSLSDLRSNVNPKMVLFELIKQY